MANPSEVGTIQVDCVHTQEMGPDWRGYFCVVNKQGIWVTAPTSEIGAGKQVNYDASKKMLTLPADAPWKAKGVKGAFGITVLSIFAPNR